MLVVVVMMVVMVVVKEVARPARALLSTLDTSHYVI